MVLDFLRGSSSGTSFDHVVTRAVEMLADAQHSFDLASLALFAASIPDSVAADVRATDERINAAEHELRSELIVHVAVHGSANIGSVLGFTVLLKKIERIGDQAKNILDLVEAGVSLADVPELETLRVEQRAASAMFGTARDLLAMKTADEDAVSAFEDEGRTFVATVQRRLDGYMTSDRPGREVVPLAIYDRYVRRIVANLVGVVRASTEPIPLDDGGRPDDQDD